MSQNNTLLTQPLANPSQHNTLDAVLEVWLHNRPHTTCSTYRSTIRQAQHWTSLIYTERSLMSLTHSELCGIITRMSGGLAPTTQATLVAQLKSFFKFLAMSGYRQDNPMLAVRSPKSRDTLTERIVEPDVIEALLAEAVEMRDQLIIKLGYIAGLRVAEICTLRVKDLSYQREPGGKGAMMPVLKVFGKGSKTGFLRLPDDFAQEIKDYIAAGRLQPEDFLVTNIHCELRGQQITPQAAWLRIKALANKIGVPKFSPHWLRHCHATTALDNGADIVTVSKSLRHENVATTMKYLHARPQKGSSLFIPVLNYVKKIKEDK